MNYIRKRNGHMFKEDLEKRYLTFRFPKDINSKTTRFILYNEAEKQFPIISNMNSKDDYIKIDIMSLKPHYNYKYKYQVRKNEKWVTAKPYKYLHADFKDNNNVKYRFYREVSSNYLLICFSGNGQVPAYNYIGAFSELKVNKLFIKDDFTDKTSNNSVFYMGSNKNNEVMDYISSLIDKICNEINIPKENIICCGTSKGGYASVLYALAYGYGHCVVGSPTLYLGNSLLVEGNLKNHARTISGNTDQSSIEWLNNFLISKIPSARKCTINTIIGTGERRYVKHLLPFISASKVNRNLVFNIKEENFKEHNKIATVYPPYARKIIESIIYS